MIFLFRKASGCTMSVDIMIEYMLVDQCCTVIVFIGKLINTVYQSPVGQLHSTISTSASTQTDTSETPQPVGRSSSHSNGSRYAVQLIYNINDARIIRKRGNTTFSGSDAAYLVYVVLTCVYYKALICEYCFMYCKIDNSRIASFWTYNNTVMCWYNQILEV